MIVSFICLVLIASGSFASEKIKVASIFAHTGVAAVGNRITVNGIRFAVDELNRRGGMLGRQVELIEYDNRSNALYSRKMAEEAVREDVLVVFGANWSSHSRAMAPVLNSARIPMISPFSTNPDVTRVGDYIFRICFIDSFQGRVMADFAINEFHAKTAVILVNASGRYSEGLAEYFHKRFVRRGGQVLLEESYIEDEKDFSEYLKKVISLQPDVLFVPGNIIDSARVIRQVRNAGYSKPILGGDGWGAAMARIAGSALAGTFYSGHWHEAIDNRLNRWFIGQYRKEFGDGEMDGAALAYDAVFVFAEAVNGAGSLNSEKIRSVLARTRNFRGVTGNITFDENGDPIKSAVIMKFTRGKSTYVKTIDP